MLPSPFPISRPPFIYLRFLRSISPPHTDTASHLSLLPLPPLFQARRFVTVLPSKRGRGVTTVAIRKPGQSHGRSRGGNTSIIITIIVIISQMRRAKLELCLSPSGWLTVTNSSLIHSTHQLYTGQRSPERQEATKAVLHVSSPTAARRHVAALCAQPLSSVFSFSLSKGRRQLVIMPLANAAMCRCHVSHGEFEVR